MFPIPFNFPFRKKDGSLTTIDDAIAGGGTPYTLPTASDTTKGGVKIGTGLTMNGETLENSNPTPYTLPTASADTKGGVKVGSGLEIDENGVLSASGGGGGGLSYVDLQFISSQNAGDSVYLEGSTYPQLNGKTIVAIYPLTNHAKNVWLQNASGATTAREMSYPLSGTTTYYWYADLKLAITAALPMKIRVWVI